MGYRDSLEAAQRRIAALEEELGRLRAKGDEALAERLRDVERALNAERRDHQAAAARGSAERERERVMHARVIELEQERVRGDAVLARGAIDAERDRLGAALTVAERAAERWRELAERREAEIAALHQGPASARLFYLTRIAELQATLLGSDADRDPAMRELQRLRDALAHLPE